MLDGLFRPRAVAVVGASNNPHSIGHIVVRNLAAYGFNGPIFPINPKGGHVLCHKAYTSVLEVPDEIDLVNISVSHKLVPRVVEECGNKGVKFGIVHSAGFKEVGEDGVEREQQLVALAHRYGMRIFGPNSQGIQNSDPAVSVYANFTFSPMMPGNISVVAQGGGIGEMLNLHLHRAGLGHRMYCSYGNEADVSMPEILRYYGQDEGTRVIIMQTESFKDPAAFLNAASEITPHKPIFAMKAGRTREGAVAVSSHTGALVDQAAMATAMYRKAGVVQVHDTDEMVKAAVAASSQPPPRGKRIGIITNTGGPGIQAVDEAVSQGLTLAQWSEAGRKKLRESLYAEASVGNPVDVIATAGPDHYGAAVQTLLQEEGTDMVLVFFVTAPFVDQQAIAARIAEAKQAAALHGNKPVVAVVETLSRQAQVVTALREAGLPVFEFAEDGARALASLARYAALRDRPRGGDDDLPGMQTSRATAARIIEPYQGKNSYLPQVAAYELLGAYGVRVPRVAAVARSVDLAAAAEKVGFPCVLKVDSAELVHKSDAGGVVLGIDDAAALAAAFDRMSRSFADKSAAVSYLLQEQKPAGRELIIGTSAAPGLGALVMFGLGGVLVEVIKDVVFAVSPLGRLEAREMIRLIKGYPVLEGWRGEQGVDIAALEDLLCRVARLAADFPGIREMDLNPVLAYPAGVPPTAVDVRLKLA